MKWDELAEESCSMARTLSVIGDRWTLLILRDCFLGVRRFDAFQDRLGVTRGILSDRLKQLTEAGVLKKIAYQDRPPRHEYKLTAKGLDLYPVVLSIVHWGDRHMAGDAGRPVLHRHQSCGHLFDPVLSCSECGDPLRPQEVQVLPGPGRADDRHLPVTTRRSG
ncbi:helix-turn-helix transcriptional regulator [Pseudooceanicola nitratireducens]|uniref:winged helix-turn-helix transcriptional regulator n=1 Tax=Pseudooceanicola nitratireducens TaxID=517719 RepID=UPI001C9684AA|nr:helix-turn-helix domain-containing protein [Pseudooceanicola nitratireducens]MBY6164968.1 helix-turn-helix transcriptional regulator [Pseudooceanicola nitratireducens]